MLVSPNYCYNNCLSKYNPFHSLMKWIELTSATKWMLSGWRNSIIEWRMGYSCRYSFSSSTSILFILLSNSFPIHFGSQWNWRRGKKWMSEMIYAYGQHSIHSFNHHQLNCANAAMKLIDWLLEWLSGKRKEN